VDQAIREDTLILSGSEVRRLLGVPAPGGGFHVKAAGLTGERARFAAKTNANFPDNRARFGLPAIQGTTKPRAGPAWARGCDSMAEPR
jgi:hypothetical protein